MADDDIYERLAAMSAGHERTDTRATTVVSMFRVADFDHWAAGYAKAVAADSGLLGHRVWRSQDDPNTVVVAENFDSRSYAEAAYAHEATREAMARDGIDLSSLRYEFYDEMG